jgi:hypothetical protein
LAKQGFEVTYLPVTKDGLVELAVLESAIRKDTILISIMHANNEIGTIQPLNDIGKIAREKEIYFHSDCVQTVGKIPVDVKALGVDALSISGTRDPFTTTPTLRPESFYFVLNNNVGRQKLLYLGLSINKPLQLEVRALLKSPFMETSFA